MMRAKSGDAPRNDGTSRSASIVGRDASYDLAVIKVDAAGLTTASLGNSDGLVVTNNHVVVGAATLKATVGGKSYDARILGTSECLDLAVIKLDGKNFPHFDWYTGDIKAALEVWALGYPNVGDREFATNGGGFETSPPYSGAFLYPGNVRFMLNAIAWLLDAEPVAGEVSFPEPGPTATPTLTPTPTPTPLPSPTPTAGQ